MGAVGAGGAVIVGLTLTAFATLALASAASGAAPPPRRILSFNLCADPLLLATADPGQIVALSPYARDPELAADAIQARRFPMTHGSAEEVLALKPDLVLASGSRRTVVRRLLEREGARVLDLPEQDSLAEIEAAIMTVAEAVGHPERGRATIATMQARLKAVGAPPGRGRTAAYYQRRGYLTGTGTLVDDLFARVGLANLARRLHRPVLSQISVEQMALARPDFLVMESDSARVVDQGTEMLHHPVLDRAVPPYRRLYIPQALTVCGGPAYADAVELLAGEIRAADRHEARPETRSRLSRPGRTGGSTAQFH